MPQFKLFVAPGSCARVPTIALEEIGVPFETELVRTAAGQQKSPDYLKVNPKGKVPVLVVDDEVLTENVAILSWLAGTYPEAGLLPETGRSLDASRQIADLAFFAGTVHPMVTRVAMPMKFIEDAERSFELVRPKGMADITATLRMIEDRLDPWWYGAEWSILDGYLFWVWRRLTGVGYPPDDFPKLERHAALSRARPAVARTMEREAVYVEQLKAEGNYRAPR